MIRQNVNIVNYNSLYSILDEIKENLSFNILRYESDKDLVKDNKNNLTDSLIITNPKPLKSSAGFDAIAQSVESLISIKSNKTSLYYAKKSLELSLTNYLTAGQKY